MAQKIILKIIKFYQAIVSPLFIRHCRFYPSCSNYTVETIKKYGALKGLFMGFCRIIRCSPFNKGGIDLP